ncbi:MULTISPECIES: HlyD family secretion protein [unclassified Herbaspirillum]|uniref:biotin/lipoyl-binding protein n=1 Tax=unclassified Herbaspirillum TaxID=2624150 RepID=UPI001152FAEF|nr:MULTISPECIES: HlyD family secretion protein [unclassified Herbaspirillum]MBB5392976.1 multidrug resistance efflux pump [Herbaspirillum sp. SJZ102]TQK04379.1 multidrug resistance efflux pump [Herbaspirillum sp. SJZ130]TQK09836.1 multidrug resistance efflux pump [Herbaspirillum sp. SJZ106]TWC65814.1 multidrug resistance efflux pump [Herbaspirillum sp. SJZ099]
MSVKSIFRLAITLLIFLLAIFLAWTLWQHYMVSPWTRDGRVRADVVNIAPDVSGQVVGLPVRDNQLVKKGDLLMEIDPARYQLALQQADAAVAARKSDLDVRRADVDARRAELNMRRAQARRRADMDALVVSREAREDAGTQVAASEAQFQAAQAQFQSAQAQYQAAIAQRDTARLNLERTKVFSPVDGYITNLNVRRGDYATAGAAKIAVIDSHSFWVYAYFEETKLPLLSVGDKAKIQLINGATLSGHVDSIARGIYDRDNPQSRELIADVNPTFNWVRLAQRIPVRIHLDEVPKDVLLASGLTCTVVLEPGSGKQQEQAAPAPKS